MWNRYLVLVLPVLISSQDASDISALNMTYVIEDERKRIPPSPTKPGRQRKEPNLRNLKGEVNVTTVFETQVSISSSYEGLILFL